MPTFKGFGDFSRRGVPMLKREAKAPGKEFLQVIGESLGAELPAATPVGPPIRSDKRAKGQPYSQHMKDRWFFVVGSKKIPVSAGAAVLDSVTPGRRYRVVNDSPHAVIIDKGLGRSKARQGKRRNTPSKPIGSPKAPRGIGNPVLERLEAGMSALRAKAIERARRKAPR